MKRPNDDLRAEGEPPDFDALVPPEELVRGGRTRDDFFDAVLHLDDPATVGTVADLAGHGRDAAREYLEWFTRMGIVERVQQSPATYRLNREYLTWRRVQRVRNEYDPDELLAHLDTETERDHDFAAEFGADRPDQVRLVEHAEATDTTVEDAWQRLTAWRSTRQRIEILERALAGVDDSSSGRQPRTA